MLFTKKGSETVRVTNAPGVRTAQCAVFHALPRGPEPPKNDSVVSSSDHHFQKKFEEEFFILSFLQNRERSWGEDPPKKIPYKARYSDKTQEEQSPAIYIFIVLCSIFIIALLCCCYEIFRSSRQKRKSKSRSRAGSAGSGSQRWHDGGEGGPTSGSVKSVGFKEVTDVAEEKRPNGTMNHAKSPNVNSKDYKPLANSEQAADQNDKRNVINRGKHWLKKFGIF